MAAAGFACRSRRFSPCSLVDRSPVILAGVRFPRATHDTDSFRFRAVIDRRAGILRKAAGLRWPPQRGSRAMMLRLVRILLITIAVLQPRAAFAQRPPVKP